METCFIHLAYFLLIYPEVGWLAQTAGQFSVLPMIFNTVLRTGELLQLFTEIVIIFFLHIDFVLFNFAELPFWFSKFWGEVFRLFLTQNHVTSKQWHFVLLLSINCFFSSRIVLFDIFKNTLWKSDESPHPCLSPDLRENAFCFSLLNGTGQALFKCYDFEVCSFYIYSIEVSL